MSLCPSQINISEFDYNSPHWTNNKAYAIENGLEGLTEKQTKLASYWNTPFHKICLGMEANSVTTWMVINHQASSLFNVISDGVFKKTDVGKETWRSLMDSSIMEENCNEEGFNLQPPGLYNSNVKVRIGLAVDNGQCAGYDSCIGFGISIRSCGGYNLTSTSCGTGKVGCSNRPNKNKAAFGYILVQ